MTPKQLLLVTSVVSAFIGSLLIQSNAMAQSVDEGIIRIANQFEAFDFDGDGIQEIESLLPIKRLGESPEDPAGTPLIVFVENRLLNETGGGQEQLLACLGEYRDLLSADGWDPVILQASVYSGQVHQDGKTVLAIRRFFRAVHDEFPNFGGAVLIGSFPESMLVRRWVWKHKNRSATFNGVTYNKGAGPQATFVAMVPELISPRSDVVLCDLDGNWEDIYFQPKTNIDSIKYLPEEGISGSPDGTVWPSFETITTTDKFSISQKSYEDFFFIDDCHYQVIEKTDSSLSIRCGYELLVPEVSDADRHRSNPLATPDVMVSRINPLHVATIQPSGNLDDQGKPIAVPLSAGSPNRQFVRDPAFERKLLIEYLERNLAHRRGETDPTANRVAAMWTDLQTPSKGFFAGVSKQLGGTISFPKANAVDFVRFMKTPAIIRGVSAHSNATCSVLMKGYKQEDLAKETGGAFWFWNKKGEKYVPSYNHLSVRDRVHFTLLRTLWENKKLPPNAGSFYVHGGCEAISPIGAAKYPYNSPNYGGHDQIAESLLFYGNGLALIGRAKVFYDIPRGFDDAFGIDHGRFGDVLTTYFQVESNDKALSRSVASRNRTYFWSIIGDWTLRLKYDKAADNVTTSDPANLLLMRAERLEWLKDQLEQGNQAIIVAVANLVEDANELLKKSPVSVTDNDVIPPSGDNHDYMSFGPYWWPDPSSPDGLPYINRDGVVNPESRANGSDRGAMSEMVDSVETLSLAYYLQRNEEHAKKAVDFLRVFFLDSETRMNPNLEFGQAIPGRVTGRGIGIIDTRSLPVIVDSVALLQTSQHLSQNELDGIRKWFAGYLEWLRSSGHGKAENATRNNHGTYYDVQVASFALFTGQTELAKEILEAAGTKRIQSQIQPDGQQPHELKRTKSFSYSSMNLKGLFQLARLAEHVEVDLWNIRGESQTPLLLSAYQFLEPHFESLENWQFEQIDKKKSLQPPLNLIWEKNRAYPSNSADPVTDTPTQPINDIRVLIR